MEIYKKLANLKKEVGKMTKDSSNPFFKSKYFDVNQLLEHLEPLCETHGLLILQPIQDGVVTSKLIDIENGNSVESGLKLPELNDPQKIGSAVTYYRRYTLQSLLGIQAEDDDGNKAAAKAPAKPVITDASLKKEIDTFDNVDQFTAFKKKYDLKPEQLGIVIKKFKELFPN